MKAITLLMTDSNNLHIRDDDDTELNEYVKKLSEVLKSGNVTILETSTGSAILRPNKISSILVEEISESAEVEDKQMLQVEKSEKHEDIITDG
jgi:hypothetical protein